MDSPRSSWFAHSWSIPHSSMRGPGSRRSTAWASDGSAGRDDELAVVVILLPNDDDDDDDDDSAVVGIALEYKICTSRAVSGAYPAAAYEMS